MKKPIALLTASALLLGLTACSTKESPADTVATSDTTAETIEATTTVEETTEATTIVEETTEATTTETTFVEPIYLPVVEGPDSIEEFEGYNLVWYDEFDDGEDITDNWVLYSAPKGFVNNELQEYRQDEANVFIKDNKLILKAIETEESNGSYSYSSGKVSTYKKMEIMYGKIVVSAKIPEGQGLWPAIWMMPPTEKYGPWPRCGEIDIMEILCQEPNKTYSTIHYGNPHEQQQGTYILEEGSFADGFHEYILEWEPDEMRFYVDDHLITTFNDWYSGMSLDNTKAYPAPFNQVFYLQLNLAVGGDWPGDPDENTDFNNAEFEIDYVHVYQKDEYDTHVTKPTKVAEETTVEVDTTLEVRDPDSNGNFVINPDFSDEDLLDGSGKWQFMPMEGGVGTASIEDGVCVIKTEDAGTVDYSIQFVQAGLPIVQGKKYMVSFDAWSTEDRTMKVGISGPDRAYVRYFGDEEISLTTTKTTYEFEFTMSDSTDENGRIEFNMGATDSTATINIDNVTLVEIQ